MFRYWHHAATGRRSGRGMVPVPGRSRARYRRGSSSLDKEIEELVRTAGKIMAAVVKKIFKGLTKLTNVKRLILFAVFILIAIGIYWEKSKVFEYMERLTMPVWLRYIVFACLIAVPIIYLLIVQEIDETRQRDYRRIFQEIGFKEKNGKYPYFMALSEHNGRNLYLFKSNVALKEWQAAKERLEAGFDCNILRITNKGSKKLIQLETVSSEHKIPTMINWDDKYMGSKNGEIVIGQGALETVRFNLNRTPHVLMAGETGSGKSVILRTCLWQMINQGAKVIMIDFKGGVEFGKRYEAYGEVITDRKRALTVLTELCKENEKRLALFRELEVKNLPEYNSKAGQNLCRIGVFCDEIAEMLDKKGVSKEDKPIFEQLEGKISTLARLSRATGINLFLGVQRPDANVLTGQIKNNVPVRVSGRFADKSASEIVLGSTDAVNLPDIKGRFLYKVGNEIIEFQAFYFDDDTMLHEVNVKVGDMLTKSSITGKQKQEDRGYNPYYHDIETEDKPIDNKPDIDETNWNDYRDEDLDFDFANMWSVEAGEKDDF